MGLFPKKDADFNDYFLIVYAYLTDPINLARLVISAINMTELNNLKTDWDNFYPKSQNANTATKTIIDKKSDTRDDIEELLRKIYKDIPDSALTTDDRNTLNLHEPEPASVRPKIDTAPSVILKPKTGFRMQVENRVEHDQTRPSKHEDSDGVEYKHWFTPEEVKPADPNNPTPPVPATTTPVIVGPKLSTKARFIIQLEETDGGKTLNLQSRWKNNVDESKSGPWCEVVSARVIW